MKHYTRVPHVHQSGRGAPQLALSPAIPTEMIASVASGMPTVSMLFLVAGDG
jgi:hypothetical protein